MSTPGLNRGGKPPLWAFIRPLAVATLPCVGGAVGGPSLRKGATCVRMCGVWRGLRGATTVLSLSRWRKVGLPLALWQESGPLFKGLPKVSGVATNHWVFLRCDWPPISS